jgi:hypothetical protein
MHLELKQTFNTYQAVDQALRNLILAAVPHVYVNSLSQHNITGFGNVSALTIMTSLWERYGTVTQAELAENITRMSSPWNPPQPIKDLFLQLTRGSQFASDGLDPIAFSQALRILHADREYRTFRQSMPRMAQNSRHRQKHGKISRTVHRGRARPLLPSHDFQPRAETSQQRSPLRPLRQQQPFHLQRNTRSLWHASKPRPTPPKRKWPP